MKVFCQIVLSAIALLVLVSIEERSVSAAALSRTKREEKYITRYDNFDVAGVLASKRLVRVYLNCLLETGPCTPEGRELKKYVPDAIATECIKCSPIQRKQAGIVLSHILLNYRDDFNKLSQKYDPEGKARKMYNIDQDGEDDYQDLEEA
ncbi:ejaculatory bulb-specific protein 3-like [Anoplophora glabripennis]|uniref:ejaculatory bulb-specific protein 3-like n=1 Tax=Anoplophora glabripennis TaxID=217634 RepID=UPI0008749312|nr:ejaculatory bulb-specific protein 3-like [Anoplophora glabripennis]